MCFRSLLLLLSLCALVYSVRNLEEEAICQPFLTSDKTSPFNSRLTRDLAADEHADFSCQLVLQDNTLPAKIRVFIHEGLYLLALRHIEQAGLNQERQWNAAKHLRALATFIPGAFKFSFLAGLWSMGIYFNEPYQAVTHLRNAVYGNASSDPDITAGDDDDDDDIS